MADCLERPDKTTSRGQPNPLCQKLKLSDNWRRLVRPLWTLWQHPSDTNWERSKDKGDCVRCVRRRYGRA